MKSQGTAWSGLPALGFGLGYRSPLRDVILEHTSQVDWLEIIADQFMPLTDLRRELLSELAAQFVCVPHSLNISVGSLVDPGGDYLHSLAEVIEVLDPPWFSDHLCMTRTPERQTDTLIPVRRTDQLATAVANRARAVQASIGIPLVLENVSWTVDVGGDLSEGEFVGQVLAEADCGLLLDVANLRNNQENFGVDRVGELAQYPLDRLTQIHVAGSHEEHGFRVDSHDTPADDVTHGLLAQVVDLTRQPPTVLIEWDANFPSDPTLVIAELSRARAACALPLASAAGDSLDSGPGSQ